MVKWVLTAAIRETVATAEECAYSLTFASSHPLCVAGWYPGLRRVKPISGSCAAPDSGAILPPPDPGKASKYQPAKVAPRPLLSRKK